MRALHKNSARQAEEFGRHFRTVMYPRYGPAGGGLLRLHSTYRHDLKIYSSDEGRVQMSAAAFTQARPTARPPPVQTTDALILAFHLSRTSAHCADFVAR